MTSLDTRTKLVETLHLDLVGPWNDHPFAHELLPQSPQRWYLTGYLVPENAPDEDRRSEDESDDLDQPFVPDASTMEAPSQQVPNQLLPGGGSRAEGVTCACAALKAPQGHEATNRLVARLLPLSAARFIWPNRRFGERFGHL